MDEQKYEETRTKVGQMLSKVVKTQREVQQRPHPRSGRVASSSNITSGVEGEEDYVYQDDSTPPSSTTAEDIHLDAVRASGPASRTLPPPPPPPAGYNHLSKHQSSSTTTTTSGGEVNSSGGVLEPLPEGSFKIDSSSGPFEAQLEKTCKSVIERATRSGGKMVSFSLIRADGTHHEIWSNLFHYPIMPNKLRPKEEREMREEEEGDPYAEMARKLIDREEIEHSYRKFLEKIGEMHLGCVQLDAVAKRWDIINTVKNIHKTWEMPLMTYSRNRTMVTDGSIGQPHFSDTYPTSEFGAFSHSTIAPVSADVWSHVAPFLPFQDLLSLPLVTRFHFDHRETIVWSTLYHKCFGEPTKQVEQNHFRERYWEVFTSLGDTSKKEPPSQQEYMNKFTMSSKGCIPMVSDPEKIQPEKKKKKKSKKENSGSTRPRGVQLPEESPEEKARARQEELLQFCPKLMITGCAPICAMEPNRRGADFYKVETIEAKDPKFSPDNMLLVLLTHEKGGEAQRRFARRLTWEDAAVVAKVANATGF